MNDNNMRYTVKSAIKGYDGILLTLGLIDRLMKRKILTSNDMTWILENSLPSSVDKPLAIELALAMFRSEKAKKEME